MQTNIQAWSSAHRAAMSLFLVTLGKSAFSSVFGFKGGTVLMFFYGLERFSVDLDFDYLSTEGHMSVARDLTAWIGKNFPTWVIKNSTKDNIPTIKIFCDYGLDRKLKIEISWPVCPNHYELRELYGAPLKVMRADCMFANKLIAVYSRYTKRERIANRDLYDVEFFARKNILPSSTVIRCRTARMEIGAMSTREYLVFLKQFLVTEQRSIEPNILDGLGDLIVSSAERQRLQSHLFGDVQGSLARLIDLSSE